MHSIKPRMMDRHQGSWPIVSKASASEAVMYARALAPPAVCTYASKQASKQGFKKTPYPNIHPHATTTLAR